MLAALVLFAACGGPPHALSAPGGRSAEYYATAPSRGVLVGDAADRELSRALADACSAARLSADGRLAELARVLAEPSGKGNLTPTADAVGYHAHRLGLLEPTPHLWMGVASAAAEIVPALRDAVARMARVEPLTHCGGAALRVPGGLLVALAVSRRQIELARPLPRALPADGELRLEGTLARGLDHPSLAVSAPGGAVQQLTLPQGRKIRHTLRLEQRGEHIVELLAEGAGGVTVVALFPVAVGVEPAPAPAALPQPAERDAESVAAALAELIGRERKRRGLAPLSLDARLSKVALLHSQDMSANHFVAHTSPTTGDATARAARAGLRPLVLLENIGRRYGAADLHAGLMESPGHRANILNPEVELLGLGVVAEPEGERSAFLATELFARFAAPFDARRAPAQLVEAVAARRKQQKLAVPRVDAALSRAAQRAAERFAAQPNADQRALLDQTTRGLKTPPRGVRAIAAALVLAEEIAQVAESEQLLDARLVTLGVGAAELGPGAEHALVVVLLLGLK